jgi:hypothetical protein
MVAAAANAAAAAVAVSGWERTNQSQVYDRTLADSFSQKQ